LRYPRDVGSANRSADIRRCCVEPEHPKDTVGQAGNLSVIGPQRARAVTARPMKRMSYTWVSMPKMPCGLMPLFGVPPSSVGARLWVARSGTDSRKICRLRACRPVAAAPLVMVTRKDPAGYRGVVSISVPCGVRLYVKAP
jgi:hypothetical protein